MVGPIIVFLVVCGIVATYMSIVHSFLRRAEGVDGESSTIEAPSPHNVEAHEVQRAPREQWAH